MNGKIRMQVGRTWIEVDASSVKEAMRGIAEYAEVFAETTCGLCQSQDVRPTVRTAQTYDFYEITCLSCGAKLSFGQTKEGDRLFPKRRDQDGGELGKHGWHQYEATQHQPPSEF